MPLVLSIDIIIFSVCVCFSAISSLGEGDLAATDGPASLIQLEGLEGGKEEVVEDKETSDTTNIINDNSDIDPAILKAMAPNSGEAKNILRKTEYSTNTVYTTSLGFSHSN